MGAASTTSQRLDTNLLVALGLSALAGVFLWHSWVLFPFKLLVVLMHESGHAAAALLVGGSVDVIKVSPDEGGVTWSRFNPTVLRQIVVSSAGYVGSTVSGCVLMFVASRSKEARIPLYALAVWTGAVAVLWVRDLFTLLFTLACTAALFVLARVDLPAGVRRAVLAFLASFSVLYALFDIKDDLLHLGSRGGGVSDADALANATFIPAIVWGVAWGALSLALVLFALKWSLVGRSQSAAATARPVGSTVP
jgi:hypothetical protein